MLLVSSVLSVVLLCVTGQQVSPLVDYTQCYWVYGDAGVSIYCEPNYVAVGTCGSEIVDRCNTRSAGLHCCAVKGDSVQDDCQWMDGGPGVNVECTAERLVHGTCGSSATDTCGTDNSQTISVFCCNSDVDVIKSINCEWVYEESGVNIECGLNRVVSGQCGSRLTNACNDSDDTHGAYCCDIRERNVTKTADHYDDYYDEY